jgi:hypothetical protein
MAQSLANGASARSSASIVLVVALGILIPTATVRAQSLVGGVQPVVHSKSVEGFGPDAQLVGGLGFGLDGKLNNYFLARGRLGALYASAPWIVNLGLTAEVGALAGLGFGGELELSRGGSFYGSLGVARVDHGRWLVHAGVGFMIFGLEWQHTLEGPNPSHALLLEVRLPLGLWWLQKRQEKADAKGTTAVAPPQIKPRVGQRPVRAPEEDDQHATEAAREAQSPTGGAAAANTAPAAGSGKPNAAPDAVALDAEHAIRLAEAKAAREKGDRLAEAFALSRAYALRTDPLVALQLVAAELALGKPRSARADWQRVGDVEQLPQAERERAKQLQKELAAALSHVRIELTGALTHDLAILVDGIVEPIATQGYDVALDPGAHKLQLRRGEQVILERDFQTQAGALLRLSIEVPR